MRGIAAPALSPITTPSQGRIYFDSTLNAFRISENGGGYKGLGGGGPWATGTGTGVNNIYNTNTGEVGIGTTGTTGSKLRVNNTTSGSYAISGAYNDSNPVGMLSYYNSSAGLAFGVCGIAQPSVTRNTGVYGMATNATLHSVGVLGETDTSTGSSSIGVYGGLTAGITYTPPYVRSAIVGDAHSSGYAGIFLGGNAGIGTSTPTHLLQLSGGAYSDGDNWLPTSDRAYKKDIDYNFKYGLKTVEQLKPVYYVHKQDKTNKRQIGFIAQDVKEVIPELVSGEEGSYGLSYEQLTTVLVNAIKEQQKEIEELKTELISQNKEFDTRIRALEGKEKM